MLIADVPASHSKRLVTLAWLTGATLASWAVLVAGYPPGTTGYWVCTLAFPLFPFVAGIKCLDTAKRLTGNDRLAWAMFACALLLVSCAATEPKTEDAGMS